MINTEIFKIPYELEDFCNAHNIKKENIVTIIYNPAHEYKYVLFWED